MGQAFIDALRARSVDVTTVLEQGLTGKTDIEQLRWATTRQLTLYSSNIRDFYGLHSTFLARGERHGGIILVQQRHYSIGDQVRGVLRLIATKSAKDMTDAVEFLGAWIGTP